MATDLPDGVLFGAAYYAEYQPYERLSQDLDLMAGPGFTVIRVGESVWSTWEPRDGEFDLDWLQPVLDGAHERGISAILGTPTYAVPPWLRRRYPEIAARARTGRADPVGRAARRSTTRIPAFRHLRRAASSGRSSSGTPTTPRSSAGRWTTSPGCSCFHNPASSSGFVEWLRDRYGDVETLNREWGLTYWSHRLSRLGRPVDAGRQHHPAVRPRLAPLPGRAHHRVHRLAGRARARAGRRSDQFVTTCLASHQPAQDVAAIGEPLDVVGHERLLRHAGPARRARRRDIHAEPQPSFLPWSGTAWLYLQLDIRAGPAQAPFLVTETNATSIGGSAENYPPYRGPAAPGGRGRWSPAARGWSSTGTGTPSTTARRCTGAASSATACSPAASTPSWPSVGRRARAAPARRWTGCGPAPTWPCWCRRRAAGRWSSSAPLAGSHAGLDGRPAVLRAHPRRVLPRTVRRRARAPTSSRPPSCPTTRRGRGAVAGAGRAGTVRRRRRAAGLAAPLRRGRRPSRADAAHRLRRRGGRRPATR